MGLIERMRRLAARRTGRVLAGGAVISVGAAGAALGSESASPDKAEEHTSGAVALDLEGEPVVVEAEEDELLADSLDSPTDEAESAGQDQESPDTAGDSPEDSLQGNGNGDENGDSPVSLVTPDTPPTPDSPESPETPESPPTPPSPESPDTPETPEEESPEEGEDED